uniref:Uncharacterized protein n=1 Tax=Anguilla anguilla TaxID=7936 RepID=A0A0E9VH62_ANGAN
MAQYTCSEVKV